MIIQPSSVSPRGPTRRGLRAVGLVTPIALLVVLLGAGILGPKPDQPAPRPSAATVVPAPSGSVPSGSVPPIGAARPAPAFPTVSVDLEVRSVPVAAGALLGGSVGPMAVAGYLVSLRPPATCPAASGDTRGVLSPLCERRARLVAADPSATDLGAHLDVTFPPGVRLPPSFEDRVPDGPVPVVIVGRGGGTPCAPDQPGCGAQLTADRVTWAGGASFDPGPVLDAGLVVPPASIDLRRLQQAEGLAIGRSGTILVAAVVRPSTVRAIDPDAYRAMSAGSATGGLVGYVRGLETSGDPTRDPPGSAPPRVSWVVVDEATGVTLARGVAVDHAAFPATITGLPVERVGAAIAAQRRGRSPGVVAVAGWLRGWADPRACAAPIEGLPGGGCRRTAILADAPWSDGPGTTGADIGIHITGVVPPGVVIPDQAVGLAVADLGPPPPVVVIGRFGASPAGCARGTGGCDAPFTIEAVAWTSGQAVSPGRLVGAGLAAPEGDPVAAAVADPGARPGTALAGLAGLLRVVLVARRDLAAIDPAAARALRPGSGDPSATVWYVRGLDARTAAIRWAVVEPRTGRILAHATVPRTATMTAAGVPDARG